jgi:murein DD-endopeptidase MepM/ murein hydrolase activator NlpD
MKYYQRRIFNEVITVKKNKFSEFFKGKGYYVLLFVGVIAIAAVAFVGSQLSADQNTEDQQYVDLNDTEDNTAAVEDDTQVVENNPVSEDVADSGSAFTEDTVADEAESQEVAGNDVEYDDYSNVPDSTEQAAASDITEAAVETTGNSVEPDNTKALEALSFNTEDGLLWPVDGNVIMNYSMDRTTYFATLMQYKCNPAIIIDAEVGEDVLAATDAIVTEIDADNEETGYTIIMSIGDGFSLVYGQLDKDSVSLAVGDSVKEGEVIGIIDEPTKYYTVEGSNLYFELTQNDDTINPMLYLR